MYLCVRTKNIPHMSDCIQLKGVRVNNLKNIDLNIPRNQLIVITGLSGSGKSSLAFDTLYAEGQRRYVESLSAYARQFLGRMSKPECDYIKGIPPAIAIEQKVTSRNPRSTVGTSTEIYEYLRLLYARIGRTISPISGEEVKKHTPEDVVRCMLSYSAGTRFMLLAPLVIREGRSLEEQLDSYFKQGFSRIEVDGEVTRIEDYMQELNRHPETDRKAIINLIVDRMACSNEQDAISRLTDSTETAFYEGNGQCMLRIIPSGILHTFSTRFEADGMTFEEPSDHMFAFNSPVGACPRCEGFGKIIGPDEKLVIPNSTLSIYEGAVACWRGEVMGQWKTDFCREALKTNFPVFTPYYELTREQKDYLWHGHPDSPDHPTEPCLDNFFQMLKSESYKIQYRVMLARYQGKTTCPQCHGTRLRPEAGYVKIGGRSISELTELPVNILKQFFDTLVLTDNEKQIAKRLLDEINNRLQFLLDVGLGYLTLNRPSNTLSGGESQRINLATSLGSSLVGSLYILDEPSIGLHSRDTDRLIHVLRQLQQIGNTVIVVEHDEEIIRAADYIIDIGPKAGRLGGEVVFQGNLQQMLDKGQQTDSKSYTVKYLTGQERIALPDSPRPWNNRIELQGARSNNLKGINVIFPLNVMTVVTGVSGSGKSTLVRDTFYRAMMRQLDKAADLPGEYLKLGGDLQMVKNIEFVDQNPIGKSSRSNPVTYVKAYDEIRKLFASQPLAQQMGYTAGFFSFNTEGGRCEECKGEGTVKVEMQFMADLVLECESCHGKRFKKDLLEVKFEGQDINDILNMTVNQAIEFFNEHRQEKIAAKLKTLQDVGLGYIKLGQSSSTLSGGENQRVKLAYYLGMEKTEPTIFIFDEPTTGLHLHDIRRLLDSFNALIERGHTLIIIEHNLDVIKCADYIIDLGPEGGNNGGNIVVCGTPQEVAACPQSYTGRYLKSKLAEDTGTTPA